MNKSLIINDIKNHLNFKTDKEFAEFLGIKQNTLSTWRSRNMIDYDLIISKCDFIDANWLLTGKGDMLKQDILENVKAEKQTEPYKHHDTRSNVVLESNPVYNTDHLISIPIVDVGMAAGYGYFNSDCPEKLGEITLPVNMLKKRTGNYYCGRVNGESMNPTLLHRDFVIFRMLQHNEYENIKSGDVYFIVDRSGTSCVKRIKNNIKKDGTIVCMSDSDDKRSFRDFTLPIEEIVNIYHVEWRFSNDISNINEVYYDRVSSIESKLREVEKAIKKVQNKPE